MDHFRWVCGKWLRVAISTCADVATAWQGFAVLDRARTLLRDVGTVTAEEDAGRLGA
jgi:hypothetical protein